MISLACIGMLVACYFAAREPSSLIFIIAIFALLFSAFVWVENNVKQNRRLTEKEKSVTSQMCAVGFLVITVAVNSTALWWVNSLTPIFGEGYVAKSHSENLQESAKKESYALEKSRAIKLYDAEAAVKASLKDASSAKFSGGKVASSGAVCGLVNAKNSFGGYAGEARYISIAGNSYVDDGGEDFSPLWAKLCK